MLALVFASVGDFVFFGGGGGNDGVDYDWGDCFGGRWSRVWQRRQRSLVFYARTVSSGDLYVSSSSGSCFVTSSVGGSLVFTVSGNGGDSFYKQRPRALVFASVGDRSSLAATRTTITWLGSVLVDGGGCFGDNGIARGSGCVTATVHGVCLVAFFINKDTVVK